MTATADAVVVGAGIVGAACAEALSSEGLRVTIVEPHVVGGGATAAGMGHIVVMDDSEAQFALTNYSRNLWNERTAEMPAEVEYERCGTIWVAADDEEMLAVRQKQAYYAERAVSVEALDSGGVKDAEPNLRDGLAGGLRVPDDSVIYAPCAARWLVDRTRGRSGSLLEGACVSSIEDGGVVLSDGSRISAGLVVAANGTWATELFAALAVRPRKGHLAITDRYPGFVRHQLVELGYLKSAHGHSNESVAFNIQPRRTGQVLIGSSRQYGQTGSQIDQAMLSRMLRRAVEYMPGLARLSIIRTWTGFRAATEDKLPVVGPCPGRDRVYLATGHEGLGITTSLGTARLLADLILGRTPAIDPSPYAPARLLAEPAHA
jgi:glycine/D-amino acid oxidase-like deaminating enzyme